MLRTIASMRSCEASRRHPNLFPSEMRDEFAKNLLAMIEADGAGFPEADAADIDVVQRLWGMHRPGGALVGIGSVEGTIGHCFAAAAAASLAKVAMSLRMRVLPPQIAGRHPLE